MGIKTQEYQCMYGFDFTFVILSYHIHVYNYICYITYQLLS